MTTLMLIEKTLTDAYHWRLPLISQLKRSTAMPLICPVFCPNWFFCQIFTWNRKNTGAQRAWKERSQNFSSNLIKYSRSRDRGRGISLFYRGLRIFELTCLPLQGIPCLYIMYQTKDGEGAGCTSPGRYPCHVKFLLYDSFFRILLNIQHRAWNCAGLSQRSWRVPSDPVKRSTGRSCLN